MAFFRGSSIDLGGATHNVRYVDTSGIPSSTSGTNLWHNYYPWETFAASTVSLSEAITNYKYIAIEFNSEVLYDPLIEQIGTVWFTVSHVTYTERLPLIIADSSYMREVSYVSSTRISFSTAKKIGASGTSNGFIIPSEIYGIK